MDIAISIVQPQEFSDPAKANPDIQNINRMASLAVNVPDAAALLQSIVAELLDLHCDYLKTTYARQKTHIRQVSIYILDVTCGISMRQIAKTFSLNRSTIAYTCRTIEDRRDDPAYDRFLTTAERLASLVIEKFLKL